MTGPNVQPVALPDDPRIAPYMNVKERELARQGDLFIAEGEHLTRRLLASDFPTVSVLVAQRKADEIAPLVPAHVPVYVASDRVIAAILGFKFHSGVLACGQRTPSPTVDEIMEDGLPARVKECGLEAHAPVTLVVCPEIHNVDNLGSLVRISAAFGATAMLLGPRSHDPFWRRAIRVSMGTVFRLPIVRSDDLLRDLRRLKEHWGVQLAATVLDEEAEPLTPTTTRPPRFALLLGSESQGLPRECVELCDRRLTIPMMLGTDSLNVAVAAGVFLWHLTQARAPEG